MPYTQRQPGALSVDIQVDGGAEGGDEPWTIEAAGNFDASDLHIGPQTGDTPSPISAGIWQGRDYKITYQAKPGGQHNLPVPGTETLTATAGNQFTGNYTSSGGAYVRPAAPAYGEHLIGMNLDTPVFWNPLIFRDAFMSRGRWQEPNFGPGLASSDLNAEGYPISLGGNPHTTSIFTMFQNGTYIVDWDGVGEFTLETEGAGNSKSFVASGTGSDTWTVSGLSGDTFHRCTITSLGSPTLTNIRVYHQDDAAVIDQKILNDRAEADLQFTGTIRAMNWRSLNVWDNSLQMWDCINHEDGVPGSWGHLMQREIDVCNQMNRDLYFNLCGTTTEAEIDQMMDIIEADYTPNTRGVGLNPALKWRVAWGNEIWNGLGGSSIALAQGTAMRDAGHPQFSVWEQGGQDWEAQLRYQVWISKKLMDRIGAHAKFGGWGNRTIRVLEAMCDNSYIGQLMLSAINEDGVQYAKNFDMLSVAPYLWIGFTETGDSEASPPLPGVPLNDKDQLFLNQQQSVEQMSTRVANNRAVLDALPSASSDTLGSMQLCTYEGGQHMILTDANKQNAAWANFIRDCQLDERQYGQYQEMYTRWFDGGAIDHMHWFNPSGTTGDGGWGIKESYNHTDDESPKWRAALDWQYARLNP